MEQRTLVNRAYEILQDSPRDMTFEDALNQAKNERDVDRLVTPGGKPVVQRPKAMDALEAWLDTGPWGRVEREYRFHPDRQWRADYALVDQTPVVLIEYDGIMGGQASHASIRNLIRDAEKLNHAQALGFRVFRANAQSLGTGDFYTVLESALQEVME